MTDKKPARLSDEQLDEMRAVVFSASVNGSTWTMNAALRALLTEVRAGRKLRRKLQEWSAAELKAANDLRLSKDHRAIHGSTHNALERALADEADHG